ncbi:MAG: DUF948 domain-containing protein [Gemmatimonadales bacterium]
MPTWIPVTVALSLLVIAISFLAIATAVFLTGRKAAEEAARLAQTLAALQQSLEPVLKSVKGVTDAGNEVTDLIRREAAGYAATSMRVRSTADEALQQVSNKIRDLEALYDTMYAELEETALDLGVVVRRARQPRGWIGRLKRLIGA